MFQGTGPALTSWKAIREVREKGVEVTLPIAQLPVRVRGLGLDVFLLSGSIPDSLTPVIVKAINEGEADLGNFDDLQATKDYLQLVNTVAERVLVSPRVVSDPQADDEISLDDLDFQDKVWLLQFLGKPAAALARFREEQAADVSSVLLDGSDGSTPFGDSSGGQFGTTLDWPIESLDVLPDEFGGGVLQPLDQSENGGAG